MFSLEFLRFMESMRQQPKVSQGVDQQYFERKDTATAIGTILLFSFFTMLASSMAGLIQVWRGFAFSSNCICQYFNWSLFYFMTTEKSNINILP
jgi:hypothetical protein